MRGYLCSLLLLIVALAVPGAVAAEGSPGGWHWQKVVTTNGCMFFRWMPSSAPDPYALYSYEWSGACTPDKMLEGQGTLHLRVKPSERFSIADRMLVDSIWTGTMLDGVLDGSFKNCSEGYKSSRAADGCVVRTFNKGCQPDDIAKSGCIAGSAPSMQAAKAIEAQTAANGESCAQTPDEALQAFNAEFDAFAKRHPNSPGTDQGGSRAQHQYAYFIGEEGLKLLEPYRACLGPHYAPNRSQLEAASRAGKEGCVKTSTAAETCTPAYPF